MIKWIMPLLFMTPFALTAKLNDELNKFFDRAGASVNVSSGEIYEGQKAGYMTGGGITVRGRIMDTKPLTVSLPKFDAGCGGIDIFNGGFSFIDHKQLVDTLKSIGSSAYGYAFLLGLETVSPQVSGVIKNLQTWSNNINSLNINSCETAQLAIGSVWPRKTAASQEICKRFASAEGWRTNYVKSRHDCAQENFHKSISGKENQLKWQEEINIAWESIQKQSYLAQNKDLAEFFMSLMGTVIFRGEDNKTIPDRKPSKIKDEAFLQALMEGGVATIYTCEDKNQCLRVSEKEINFSASDSWLGRVREQLVNIQNKILSDEEISDAEKALLTKSRLPLYKIVNVLTAYKKGACPVALYHVSEIVAMDLLLQFLTEAIEVVRGGALQFKTEKMYGIDEVNDFLEELKIVEKKVRYYESRSAQLFEREFLLIQKLQLIEEQLRAELTFY